MPDVTVERRGTPRISMVLAADVIEVPGGAKMSARTADISQTGCYIDTLNPMPQGSRVRLRLTHHQEVFETVATVAYASPGLGMGLKFGEVSAEQQERLNGWLGEKKNEF